MPIALPMYDLPEVAADIDAVLQAIHLELLAYELDTRPSRPASLHRSWQDPQMVLSQSCGMPLVGFVAGEVVGTFTHAGHGGRYRSVLVGAGGRPPRRAAVNDEWSLSGWVSLLVATGNHPSWPGEVVWTGGHRQSIAAVREGRADIASIDAVTWDLLTRYAPGELDGLDVVGEGPETLELPLVTAGRRWVPMLRDVLASVVASDTLGPSLERLLITGFRPLDRHDYDGVDELVRRALGDYPAEPR